MTPAELGVILARATGVDPRVETNDFATDMWMDTIGDLSFAEARDALVQHYRETKDRVYPSDIRTRVKDARRARADALPSNVEIMSDVPNGHPSWAHGLQLRRAAMIDDGLSLNEAREKYPAPPIRPELSEDGTPEVTATRTAGGQ